MKWFYCPQKDGSLDPWDSLSPKDQTFLQDKYPDAGQGAVCNMCVRCARPSAFFSRRSSSTLSSPPQSGDSRLQVLSAPLVVSGAAMSLATDCWCCAGHGANRPACPMCLYRKEGGEREGAKEKAQLLQKRGVRSGEKTYLYFVDSLYEPALEPCIRNLRSLRISSMAYQ